MKRKFVKENKQLVKELLGGLISKIITGRAPKNLRSYYKKTLSIKRLKKKLTDWKNKSNKD